MVNFGFCSKMGKSAIWPVPATCRRAGRIFVRRNERTPVPLD